MIVIQCLVTVWTKKSRGGPLASQRNATPEALPLTAGLSTAVGECLVHEVRFDESHGFQPEERWMEESQLAKALSHTHLESSVRFQKVAEGLAVGFKWPGDAGLPERRSLKRVFLLKPGEWGRLVYNGRFVVHDIGDWYYEKKVINISNGLSLEPTLFLSTEPAHSSSMLAELF
jgi:hypothetical protein